MKFREILCHLEAVSENFPLKPVLVNIKKFMQILLLPGTSLRKQNMSIKESSGLRVDIIRFWVFSTFRQIYTAQGESRCKDNLCLGGGRSRKAHLLTTGRISR